MSKTFFQSFSFSWRAPKYWDLRKRQTTHFRMLFNALKKRVCYFRRVRNFHLLTVFAIKRKSAFLELYLETRIAVQNSGSILPFYYNRKSLYILIWQVVLIFFGLVRFYALPAIFEPSRVICAVARRTTPGRSGWWTILTNREKKNRTTPIRPLGLKLWSSEACRSIKFTRSKKSKQI